MIISAPMTITWRAGRCSLPLIALLAESISGRSWRPKLTHSTAPTAPEWLEIGDI